MTLIRIHTNEQSYVFIYVPLRAGAVGHDHLLSPERCGAGNLPPVPYDTLNGALHLRANSLCVTMLFRIRSACWEIRGPRPAKHVMRALIADELVVHDHVRSHQNCGRGNLPHVPRDTLHGMLRLRVNWSRVTMSVRFKTTGREICHACPVTHVNVPQLRVNSLCVTMCFRIETADLGACRTCTCSNCASPPCASPCVFE